jgi:hypothetical protein
MSKIIQTIVLTAVVFSPLSLISLVTSATAHHTSSHVSTTAVAVNKTRKKAVKKRTTSGTTQQKPKPDATTQPPEAMPPASDSMPAKPTQPDVSSDKMKPSGVITPKPGSTEIPPAGSASPNIPAVPGSNTPTPTLPSTIPAK